MLMEKYRLSAEEVMIIDCLFLAGIEEGHKEYLIKYFNLPITRTDLRDILVSLQNKGIITKEYKIPAKGTSFDPESVIFNQNFLHSYRKFSGDLGVDLMKCFPSIAIINGIEYNIQNFAKKFKSEEEFYYAYGKSIGWKMDKHKEVMELITWAKVNKCNLLNLNIADFVIIKSWEKIREFKENTYDELTFDNVKDL